VAVVILMQLPTITIAVSPHAYRFADGMLRPGNGSNTADLP
jgi:hypothetical protein